MTWSPNKQTVRFDTDCYYVSQFTWTFDQKLHLVKSSYNYICGNLPILTLKDSKKNQLSDITPPKKSNIRYHTP